MFSWFRRRVFQNNGAAGNYRDTSSAARNRLHFVLVQDRAGLNAEELAQFKREMISVIEKYFVIDENGFDIAYKRTNETTTLLINSPIIVRRQEGIKGVVGARQSGQGKQSKIAAKEAAATSSL